MYEILIVHTINRNVETLEYKLSIHFEGNIPESAYDVFSLDKTDQVGLA
jgi:hypothetical protein